MTHTLKSRQRNDTELAKNERIWLEPAGAPDRCWCEDNQWGEDGVEYVRVSALPAPDDGLEVVAWAQGAALDELAKHKDATITIASGLLPSPFGSPVALVRLSAAQRTVAVRNAALNALAERCEAAEQQVQKLTAENERVRDALEAADYLIDRLRNAWFGNSVRDMDEAEVAYTTARTALETQEGGK